VTCCLELASGGGDVLDLTTNNLSTFRSHVYLPMYKMAAIGPATAPGTYIQVCVYINEQGGFPHTTIVCNHLCESVCVCTCVAAAKQNTEEAIGIFTCKSCESAEGGGPYFRYSWLAVGEQSQLTS